MRLLQDIKARTYFMILGFLILGVNLAFHHATVCWDLSIDRVPSFLGVLRKVSSVAHFT